MDEVLKKTEIKLRKRINPPRRLNMRTTLVYDLPTRLFHWLFSGLFLLSFVITKTVDDESLVFSYHMLSGLLLGGLVLWRVFWGVF